MVEFDYIPSPCLRECRLVDNMCISCYRLLNEIQEWPESSNNKKREIVENCVRRKNARTNRS